jgi:hypothetical protein
MRNKRILLFVIALMTVRLALQTGPAYGQAQRHEGDLILSGNQELVVDSEVYVQRGNIELHDNAMLIILNGGELNFEQDYHEQYFIRLFDNSQLIVDGGTMRSPQRYYVWIQEGSMVELKNAKVAEGGAIWNVMGGKAVFKSTNSNIDMLYPAYTWRPSPDDHARISVEGGTMHQLSPDFDLYANATLQGLRQDVPQTWSLNKADTGLPYDLSINNVNIHSITLWIRGHAQVTIRDSEIGQLSPDGQAEIRLVDSYLSELVPRIEVKGFVLENLRTGEIDTWDFDLRDLGGYWVAVEDSIIDHHTIRFSTGAQGIIRNCNISQLRLMDNAQVVIQDSQINSLWFWNYTGTVTFEDTVVDNWEDTRMYPGEENNFWIKGEVTIREAGIIIQEMGDQWFETVAHREFPVLVTYSGVAAENAELTIRDPDGNVVWRGKTDQNGYAVFSLTFDKTNYKAAWTLSANIDGTTTERLVYMVSSTPLLFSLSPPTPMANLTPTFTNAPAYTTRPTQIATSWPSTTMKPIEISIARDGYYQVYTNQPIILRLGWAADSQEYLNDVPNILDIHISVDGKEIEDIDGSWGVPEEHKDVDQDGDMDYVRYWKYTLGEVSMGGYQIISSLNLKQQISNGFDFDGDGALDTYGPGQFFVHVIDVNVITSPMTTTPKPAKIITPQRTFTVTPKPTKTITPQPSPTAAPTLAGLIAVDGNPSDWAGFDPLVMDPIGDGNDNADLSALYGFMDTQYIYLRLDTSTGFGGRIPNNVWYEIWLRSPTWNGKQYQMRYERGTMWLIHEYNEQLVFTVVPNAIFGEILEIAVPITQFPSTPEEVSVWALVREPYGENIDETETAILQPLKKMPTKTTVCQEVDCNSSKAITISLEWEESGKWLAGVIGFMVLLQLIIIIVKGLRR